jgi:large subunit ribosomal protein L15
MPLQRRLPKFGFKSAKAKLTAELRLHELLLADAAIVDIKALKEANLVPACTQRVKVILSGEISEAVHTRGLVFTKGARAAVEAAGGKIEE